MTLTVKSLKKENDSLKAQLASLQSEFLKFQEQFDKRSEASPASNGGRLPSDVREVERSLEFVSHEYDDLSRWSTTAKSELQRLSTAFNDLAAKVDSIADAIDAFERYSYQYNIKLLGVPERGPRESALETSSLCVGLFSAMGAEVTAQDIDIAHRVPTRNATAGPKPIVCKFVRRLAKERVMTLRNDASKVNPTAIGLPEDVQLSDVKIFDHLTPKLQQLLADAKRFKNQHNYSFCWTKNSVVFLRRSEDSRPIAIKNLSDLQNLAPQQ